MAANMAAKPSTTGYSQDVSGSSWHFNYFLTAPQSGVELRCLTQQAKRFYQSVELIHDLAAY